MAVETVDVEAMTPEDFAALVKRSSDSDLTATIRQAGEERVLRLPDTWSVQVGSGLMGELRVLLGPNSIL